jgi:chemotaxis family two-component system response regulator Rcp1
MDPVEPDSGPVEILLVDDEPGDVRLTERGLRRAAVPSRLHVATDGEEALAFLRRHARDPHAPLPDLVLLDLNLPTISGFEVLEAVRADPELTAIPIIVLTTSGAETDVQRAYEAHANAYMTKPVAFDQFVESIRALTDYWFLRCRIPHLAGPQAERID